MALGMGFDEYWNCSPKRYRAYRKAHELKNEQRNQEMWLQGFYVYKAIETALHNQPAFATKPVKPVSYLQEPIRITPYTEQEKQRKAKEEEEKKLADFEKYLTDFQKSWEKKHGRVSKHTDNKNKH